MKREIAEVGGSRVAYLLRHLSGAVSADPPRPAGSGCGVCRRHNGRWYVFNSARSESMPLTNINAEWLRDVLFNCADEPDGVVDVDDELLIGAAFDATPKASQGQLADRPELALPQMVADLKDNALVVGDKVRDVPRPMPLYIIDEVVAEVRAAIITLRTSKVRHRQVRIIGTVCREMHRRDVIRPTWMFRLREDQRPQMIWQSLIYRGA
jgi:hypothetical protein